MDLSPGQYFLIQFSPSPARHERLNVGVIAICESWMKFKFDPDITRRVSDFCGAKWAVPVVHGQCLYLAQWLASLSLRDITVDILSERIEELSRRLANEIVISGPYVRLFSDFDTLFDELVSVPKDRVPESRGAAYPDQSSIETPAKRRDMIDKAGWKEIEDGFNAHIQDRSSDGDLEYKISISFQRCGEWSGLWSGTMTRVAGERCQAVWEVNGCGDAEEVKAALLDIADIPHGTLFDLLSSDFPETDTAWKKVSDVEAWVVSEGDCDASMVFLRLAKVGSFWSARLDVNEPPSTDSFVFRRPTPQEALGMLEAHIRFNRIWIPDRIRTALNTLPKGVE